MSTQILLVITAALAFLIVDRTADAQTSFSVPDSSVSIDRYVTPEECVSLGTRLRRQYRERDDSARFFRPLSRPLGSETDLTMAVQASRRCMDKFDPESVDITPDSTFSQFRSLSWIKGYLLARDFESSDKVRQREISLIPDDSVSMLSGYHFHVLHLYQQLVKPMDLDMLDTLDEYVLRVLSRRGRDPRAFHEIVQVRVRAMDRRISFKEHSVAAIMASDILKLIDEFDLQPSDFDKMRDDAESYFGFLPVYLGDVMHRQAGLDSLRIGGPDAYIGLKRELLKAGSGSFMAIWPAYTGEDARPVDVSFFYPQKGIPRISSDVTTNSDSSIPKEGRTSMVVFLLNACRRESNDGRDEDVRKINSSNCWDVYGVLERLNKRFPDLDITLVTQTKGMMGPRLIDDPQDEAEQIRSLWHDHHKLPVNIGVSYTPFFRLTAPDYRRVDETPEYINYYFSHPFFPLGAEPNKIAFIISSDRKVLLRSRIDQGAEADIIEFLDALMASQRNNL